VGNRVLRSIALVASLFDGPNISGARPELSKISKTRLQQPMTAELAVDGRGSNSLVKQTRLTALGYSGSCDFMGPAGP
jgi:hypothetical protein